MNITIRKPTPHDKKKIKRFLNLLQYDFVPSDSEEEMERELKEISEDQASAALALALKGLMIGYISWEPYPKNHGYAYIRYLGVHLTYRQKGVATELAQAAFEVIKKSGFKGAYYTTWHTNLPMIKLSKKLNSQVLTTYLDENFRGPGGKTILFRKEF